MGRSNDSTTSRLKPPSAYDDHAWMRETTKRPNIRRNNIATARINIEVRACPTVSPKTLCSQIDDTVVEIALGS